MVVIKVFSSCSIGTADLDDYEEVYVVLSKAVVGTTGTANERMRKARILRNNMNKAMKESNIIVSVADNKIIGACVLNNDKICAITHLNILPAHRTSAKSGNMLNYILNTVYAGKTVYFSSDNEQLKTVGEIVKDDTYKVKNDIAGRLLKIYGEI